MQQQDQHLYIGAHHQVLVLNHLAIWRLMGLPLEEVPTVRKISSTD